MTAALTAALAVGLAAWPAAARPPKAGVVVLTTEPERGQQAEHGEQMLARLSREGWFSFSRRARTADAYEHCFRPGPDRYTREWDEACVRAVLDAAPSTDAAQIVVVFETTRMVSSAERVSCIGRGGSRTYQEMVHVPDALGSHPDAGPHARVAAGRCLLSAVFDAGHAPSGDDF